MVNYMMLSHTVAIILAVYLFTIPLLTFPKLSKTQLKLVLLFGIGLLWTVSEFIPEYFYFSEQVSLLLHKISFALSTAMFGALLTVTYDLLRLSWSKATKIAMTTLYTLITLTVLTTDLFAKGLELNPFGDYDNIPGPGYYPIVIFIVITVLVINALFIREIIAYKEKDNRRKIIVLLFFFTSLPPLIGIIYNLILPALGVDAPPIAHITYIFTAIGFMYAIYQYKAFEIVHEDIPIWGKIYFVINIMTVTITFLSFFTYYQVVKTNTDKAESEHLRTSLSYKREQIDAYIQDLTHTATYALSQNQIKTAIVTKDYDNPVFKIFSDALRIWICILEQQKRI
jgi:hypothetical protein